MTKDTVQPHNAREIAESSLRTPPPALYKDEELTVIQKQILEHLGDVELALTINQLKTALACTPVELLAELDGLQDKGLILKLNTIIPSYASRYPGVCFHGEYHSVD